MPLSPLDLPGLISFWDFQGAPGADLTAKGAYPYRLRERNGPIFRASEGIFGPQSIWLSRRTWLEIPHAECPALHRCGEHSALTVLAWINRYRQINDSPNEPPPPEAIAGIWNETEKQRQYCLFLNILISGGAPGNVSGHVSHTGGPTAGRKYCEDVSAGKTCVPFLAWTFVGFTFDGQAARSYLNGVFDENPGLNPFPYPGGLFPAQADFTVGAVHRSGEMGNWYRGLLGGLAVYERALSDSELLALAQATLPLPAQNQVLDVGQYLRQNGGERKLKEWAQGQQESQLG